MQPASQGSWLAKAILAIKHENEKQPYSQVNPCLPAYLQKAWQAGALRLRAGRHGQG